MKTIKESNEFIGMKFGRLTILEVDDHVTKIDKTNHRFCKCKCDCGKECYRDLYLILRGGVKSCGCLHNESLEQTRQKRKTYNPKVKETICISCGEKPVYAKGYCRNCYVRFKRNGFVTPSRKAIAENKRQIAELVVTEDKNLLLRKEYGNLVPKTKTEKLYYDLFMSTTTSLRDVAKQLEISVQCLSQTLKRMKNRNIY